MVEKDPFLNFISDLSEKIKVSRDHKQIMERVSRPEDSANEAKASLENLILTIGEKIASNITKSETQSVSSIKEASTEVIPITSKNVKILQKDENHFEDFVLKLKNILNNPKTETTISTELTPISAEIKKSEQEESTQDYIKILDASKENRPNKKQTQKYIEELDKVKDSIQIEKEDSKVTEIKKLIEDYAEKYIKKAVGMIGESGGGTVAVQYANGGTMNGDLNVNGNYLSGGVNLLNIFGTGGTGSVNKILPGNNIAISPTVGTGTVTINSTTINYLTANRVAISAVDITSNLSVGFVNIVSTAPGTSDLSGIYRLTNEYSFGYPIYRNINGNGSRIERSGGPDAWYIYNSGNNNVYFNTTTGTPWEGVWITIPGRPSPPPSVTVFDPFINSLGTISVAGQGNSKQWSSSFTTVNVNSAYWDNAYTNLVSNSAYYLGVEKVSALNTSNYNFDLDQYSIYTKRVTGENVFTYQNFVSGRTLTVYLCADHPQAVGHYFPFNTYFGDDGTSNIVYTFSGYTTKLTIQNVGSYFLGSTFLIPFNVPQYIKAGDYMLMESLGFILLEDDYRIILD